MKRDISQFRNTRFDVLIVGAGIHGACAARDAALRGLSVALIDKGDLSGATSHNSLKTIHGGIRYLQHLNFKRTFESINEQKYWLRTAPHLVKPLPFLMPTYGYGSRGPEAMWAGIKLYETLGAGRNKTIPEGSKLAKGSIISKKECLNIASDLEQKGLRGGGIWYDAQVEDADRAVIQVCQDAAEHGAVIANHSQALRLTVRDNEVRGVIARDELTGSIFTIKSKIIINATGPWAGRILKENKTYLLKEHKLPLTKSMNIVTRQIFPDYAVGVKSALESDAVIGSSKRLYFIVPWRGKSIIGTTHFPHRENIDKATNSFGTTKKEIKQFVADINAACPALKLNLDEVLYCYQGLTPANEDTEPVVSKTNKKTTKKVTANRLHHSKVVDHHSEDSLKGLISLVSVKWTTARGVAEKAIDLVCKKMNKTEKCQTHTRKLKDTSIQLSSGRHLNKDSSKEDLTAFVNHAVDHEMALTLPDLLLRRCDALMLDELTVEQVLHISTGIGIKLGWTKNELNDQKKELLKSWLKPEFHEALSETVSVIVPKKA